MNAVLTKDDELREKINTFMARMNKMETRVQQVETIAASVARMEEQISKVEAKIESRLESRIASKPSGGPSVQTPPPVKAFISGASIGILIVGVVTAAWVLGFF